MIDNAAYLCKLAPIKAVPGIEFENENIINLLLQPHFAIEAEQEEEEQG